MDDIVIKAIKNAKYWLAAMLIAQAVSGCASSLPPASELSGQDAMNESAIDRYRIGPGDSLEVFVWRNPEISTNVVVRPDGMISTPLVEDMVAVGKTPTQLARDIENVLATYVKSPSVNVIVSNFQGVPSDMIRVVGQAQNPQAISYREGMTVLDVMIAVGGLGEFAAGNRARLVRRGPSGEIREYRVRLSDLLNEGAIDQNIEMQPGDVLTIPEAYF